ncbi:MAG: hypothetical protein O7I42_07685, partial [Alphaproteobacteria bacterium]|nr:hypothetical protein [Alphaproteobacteria bacterium]
MKYLQLVWKKLWARWKLAVGLLTAGAVVAVFAFAQLIGILAIERHQGFFAPVWDTDGQHIYVIERDTRGLIWGLGWEFFTPPANSYVISDRFVL